VEVRPGDLIWLRGLGRAGEALSTPDERGEVEVTLGSLRTRVRVDQIERTERPKTPRTGSVQYFIAPAPVVPLEIEVRGQTLEEAMPKVEQFVDDAFRAGLPWVRIIHGKGTGTLRRAVRDLLARSPLIKDYDYADRAEGGEGVTVAHFVS
jgi:DNA mismatch repair protein MutS2